MRCEQQKKKKRRGKERKEKDKKKSCASLPSGRTSHDRVVQIR
jgi:hypothetical protein